MITETQEQKVLYRWFCMQWPKYKKSWSLSMNGIYIPGKPIQRAKIINSMKAQGMQVGESDYKILVAKGGFHGLIIEQKSENGKHKLTQYQIEYLDYMSKMGFFAVMCKGIDAAKDTINSYLNQE
jgi:hypothetical protein